MLGAGNKFVVDNIPLARAYEYAKYDISHYLLTDFLHSTIYKWNQLKKIKNLFRYRENVYLFV